MKQALYFLKQIHEHTGKTLYLNLFATTLISLLDGVGILLLLPMISMSGFVNIETEGTPLSSAFLFFENLSSTAGLSIILGIFVFITIIQNLLSRHITIKNTAIQNSFLRHLRVETYDAILHAKWPFFIKKRKSDLINLITAEIARASIGTYSLLQFLSSFVFTLIQIIIAFWISTSITVFVLLSGVILILFSRHFLKRSLALGTESFELGKNVLAGITDQINGIKDVKSNMLEKSRMNWFRSITLDMQKQQVNYANLKTKSQFYYKVASSLLIAAFILTAVNIFNAHAGQLVLIIVIFSRLWPRVTGIQSSLEQIATTLPSFRAVIALQEECKQVREFHEEEVRGVKALQLSQGIECHNVHFRYLLDQPKFALENVNILIPAKRMTAIVGKSGAGKSTLIDLLMGLNQPEQGDILLDGKPLNKENLLSLRKAISYVPQDPFLFNGSVRDNLMLVTPNATDEELWEAITFSSAEEFVQQLPNGLETIVGDRGIRLSGGERQRLVLARSILRKPSILVLDEATSALDIENEEKIQEALSRLRGTMTIIVIAHRLSTVRNADQVIVLDEGKVIQKGGFVELSKEKSGMFSSLIGKQVRVLS